MNQAQKMAEENGLSEEINQAYIDNVGEEYAEADGVEEAFAGEFDSDEDFAQDMAENTGELEENWPYNCIDWEHAAHELMFDYFEADGYYFRNL